MGLVEIIGFIKAVMQFLPEVRKLISLLSKTPAEKRADVMTAIEKEADKLRGDGRPSW